MADYSLTIYHLFDDLLNLYGDKGNVSVLEKRCSWRGIETNVKTLHEGETPDFSDVDIALLGGGSDREQLLVSKYSRLVSAPLKEYVENGGVLLAVCAGYQLLGNYYEAGGEKIQCFGILDIDTTAGDKRLIGDLAIEANLGGETVTLAGFENHGGRTNVKSHNHLGRVICGYGDDGTGSFEGVHYKNVIATYLHGPILPKNPELADFLIKTALKRKYSDFNNTLAPLDDTYEQLAKQFIIDRKLKERNDVK